jgi:hypothetical protein
MPAPFEILILTLDPVSWTPVTVPFDCNSLSIRNRDRSNAIRIRTNPNDSATEDLLGPGMEQSLSFPFHRYRYLAGSQPVFLQATAGTGPAVAKFLV